MEGMFLCFQYVKNQMFTLNGEAFFLLLLVFGRLLPFLLCIKNLIQYFFYFYDNLLRTMIPCMSILSVKKKLFLVDIHWQQPLKCFFLLKFSQLRFVYTFQLYIGIQLLDGVSKRLSTIKSSNETYVNIAEFSSLLNPDPGFTIIVRKRSFEAKK